MQTRRTVIAVLAALAVFYLWIFIYNRFWPAPPPTTQPTADSVVERDNRTQPSTAPSTTRQAAIPETQAEAVTSSIAPATTGGLRVDSAALTEPVVLGTADLDGPFPMSLDITPVGAAVKQAHLRDYWETVERKEHYRILEPAIPDLESQEGAARYSFMTQAIRFVDLQKEVALDRVVWQRETTDDEHVSYSVTVRDEADSPLARVSKTYALPRQPADPKVAGRTYDLGLSLTVENLTGDPLRIVLVQQGPIGFSQEQARGEDRKVLSAIWEQGSSDAPQVKGHFRAEVVKQKSLPLGSDDQSRRIAWIAEANQYFTCIMAPAGRLGPDDAARFERAEAVHFSDVTEGFGQDLSFRFVTTPISLTAGGRHEVGFDCYLGPKSKRVFESVDQYQKRNYYAVITESFYFCAPEGLTSMMMWLLDTFHRIPPYNYGVAIFILVILVRTILHPITKKSQVNMTRMQKQMSALQPKLAAAKEKYGNDRQAYQQATMEIYRDAGINPAASMLSCLPMMLQLPIWGALWTALASTIEMRHAPFDGYWIKDLTQPDNLISFGTSIHIPLLSYLMGGPVTGLNLLPILLGATQLLQSKFMPRGTPSVQTKDGPDQLEQQRKMMMFMSVFFVFLLYSAPSGLNLYIMSSNLFGILEQWRIRKHLADLDEKHKNEPPPPLKPREKSWLQRKWESLQREADDARKLQGDRKKGKNRPEAQARR